MVTLIFGFVLYPYVYLVARASFARQSATLLEASRTLGHGPAATFRRVALPLARPAMAAGVGLVAMEVLNDYGAVKYYGVTTFTTGIFRSWFGLGDLSSAIRLSAMLMVFVFALLALERSQRGRAAFAGGRASERPLLRRGCAAARRSGVRRLRRAVPVRLRGPRGAARLLGVGHGGGVVDLRSCGWWRTRSRWPAPPRCAWRSRCCSRTRRG
jgi:ABC-type Fe3+ transport system permease subunit